MPRRPACRALAACLVLLARANVWCGILHSWCGVLLSHNVSWRACGAQELGLDEIALARDRPSPSMDEPGEASERGKSGVLRNTIYARGRLRQSTGIARKVAYGVAYTCRLTPILTPIRRRRGRSRPEWTGRSQERNGRGRRGADGCRELQNRWLGVRVPPPVPPLLQIETAPPGVPEGLLLRWVTVYLTVYSTELPAAGVLSSARQCSALTDHDRSCRRAVASTAWHCRGPMLSGRTPNPQ
jgi:hypothetical protein